METKAKKLSHTALATGESTGHAHRAVGAGAAIYETAPETWYLSAPAGAEVVHEEHKPITLPPGEYDRAIVREWDYDAAEARYVVD